MGQLHSRVGIELELLVPRGRTRADLAWAVADAVGGGGRPAFHRDSEPSAVPGMGTFRHLTPAFDVVDAAGRAVCSVVDDITIVADLDTRAAPLPGWHRVLTDDARLLALLDRVCDPAADLDGVLGPMAALFGTAVQRSGAVRRVVDADGRSVAMAAPVSGERHRPAEIVTTPLTADHGAVLERLLAPARRLGCTVPREAAVHLHFDADPYRTPSTLANLVVLFSSWRAPLRTLLGTNPACRRLGPPHPTLVGLVDLLRALDSWTEVAPLLAEVPVVKFCDVNLVALLTPRPVKDTLEVRILPGACTVEDVLPRAACVERLLDRCRDPAPLPTATGNAEEDLFVLCEWAGGVPSGHGVRG